MRGQMRKLRAPSHAQERQRHHCQQSSEPNRKTRLRVLLTNKPQGHSHNCDQRGSRNQGVNHAVEDKCEDPVAAAGKRHGCSVPCPSNSLSRLSSSASMLLSSRRLSSSSSCEFLKK